MDPLSNQVESKVGFKFYTWMAGEGNGWGSLDGVLWLVVVVVLLLQDKKSIDGFLIDTGSHCIFTCI